MDNPYLVLGLDATASEEEIEVANRRPDCRHLGPHVIASVACREQARRAPACSVPAVGESAQKREPYHVA